MEKNSNTGAPVLALIVPCYNEQEVLAETHRQLSALMAEMRAGALISPESRVVYVDDGSLDRTWQMIEEFCAAEPPQAMGVKLARNAGHQNALMAGMEVAMDFCDISITIDADLQDDIRAIPEMVKEYLQGSDVVLGVRKRRATDTAFKRFTAQAYYKLLAACGAEIVYNHADFRLLSRRAMRDLLSYEERNLFLRGLITRLGYRHSEVYYDRLPRQAGETKYPLRKMLSFALDGITSFSVRPVRMVSTIGIVFLVVAIGIMVYSLVRYSQGETLRGWASLMISLWFCSGVVLIALGIIGEYIGKIYSEVKRRPRFHIETIRR